MGITKLHDDEWVGETKIVTEAIDQANEQVPCSPQQSVVQGREERPGPQNPDVQGTADSIVDHPPHYTSHPSGVECIQVTEHMNFCLGNAVKYIWRAGLKGDNAIEDLRKACWYINREIAQRESRGRTPSVP